MLDAIEAYLRQGGRLMYHGRQRLLLAHRAPSDARRRDRGAPRARAARAPGTPSPANIYHSFSGEYGGLWRSNGRAPQCLAGVGFISQGFDHCSYYRRTPDRGRSAHRLGLRRRSTSELIGDFGAAAGRRRRAGDRLRPTSASARRRMRW